MSTHLDLGRMLRVRRTEGASMSKDIKRTGGPKGSGLTPAMIEYEKITNGLTQAEIARKFGVTPQSVSYTKRYGGRKFSKSVREHARESFPWQVPAQQQDCWIDKRLRDHAEYRVAKGKGMSEDKLQRLRWFYAQLLREGVVVEFDPNNPPNENTKHGGYRLVPRKPSDGTLLIRLGHSEDMTRGMKEIWKMPSPLP